jgi:hypothetical protein
MEHPFHNVQFHNNSILDKTSGCMEYFIWEATEIELYPDNINRECFLHEQVMEASHSYCEGTKDSNDK